MQDCALLDTAEVEEAVYEDADMQVRVMYSLLWLDCIESYWLFDTW